MRFVSLLSELEAGDRGEVSYLHTKDKSQMQKLMSMGMLPGVSVALVQKFPSYVLQSGQSQFAIDKDLASVIHVRISG